MSAGLPAVDEQIQAILDGEDLATWALNRLGQPADWRDDTERCEAAVRAVFTLTRADFEAHLTRNGIRPESWVATVADGPDGTYFIAETGGWRLYWQERGGPYPTVHFTELAEAHKLLINEKLGPWLDHLHVPARTTEGMRTGL